jgi:glycogen debranching enzyme
MTTPTNLTFDIRDVPFSVRGAWLNLSPVVGLHTTADTIHLVAHKNGMHGVLALQSHRGEQPVGTTWVAEAARLTWRAPDGAHAAATFDGTAAIRLRGAGLALRIADPAPALTPFTGCYLFRDPVDGAAVFTSYETGSRYRITLISGSWRVEGSEALGVARRAVVLGDDAGAWEAVLEEMTSAKAPYRSDRSFDEVVADVDAEFGSFLQAVAPWRDDRTPGAALAAYVLWSATVEPSGFVTRESVLMSKHWMDKVWSWDHCFNALALAEGLPELALDQFLAPFDHQDEAGALPDSITHSEVLHNFVKPPIHGWTLSRLRETTGLSLQADELVEVHDRLVRWTAFWLDSRRRPGHELPYYQHGNDSGWDNSTTFDRDRVIEAPDLAAFLVLQLEVLGDLAAELGRPAEAWKAQRDRLLERLVEELWTGEVFIAKGALSERPSSASSLLNVLPLVLGERLPEDIRQALAERVRIHLTAHGPATEPVDSPDYASDGYWRGPIWAPSTALVEDGLRRCGFAELADTVSDRFRRLCETSGFAENFDAETGAGLRDKAYTWTAAVYLMFAAGHVARAQESTAPS